MSRFALLFVAASCLPAVPAIAGSAPVDQKPIILAEDFCVGPACVGIRDRDRDEWRYRRHERYGERYGEGCREVTVRERRGDEVVERRTRRCD
jgi:hypothetical protein